MYASAAAGAATPAKTYSVFLWPFLAALATAKAHLGLVQEMV